MLAKRLPGARVLVSAISEIDCFTGIGEDYYSDPAHDIFYRGLLELSKSFLDAFGLRTPGEQPIEVDVLMSEVNADLRQMATGAHTLPEVAGFRSPT